MEKIIIVEDEEVIRDELKSFLERYGYEVMAPTEFDNIVEFILSEKPNLVLLDINLPIYDGYYICRVLRKESNIPI
ncbi:response regulator, partial [Clostridioides difficile]